MTIKRGRALMPAAVALAVVGLTLWAAGCGKSEPKIKMAKAEAYHCENCQHVFGVPFGLSPSEKLFPPIVCPKCSQRTAVRASYYTPKGGGAPELYRLWRYTDKQIRICEKYIKSLPEDSHAPSIEEVMGSEQTEQEIKYPSKGNKWLKAWGQSQQGMAMYEELNEMKARFKSTVEVFDPEWPIYEREDLKQWK
jgi:hypothetical protein